MTKQAEPKQQGEALALQRGSSAGLEELSTGHARLRLLDMLCQV
ncbi:MAG: hypothetical protein ACR2OW_05575 [Methyloligellaceae bacterium]